MANHVVMHVDCHRENAFHTPLNCTVDIAGAPRESCKIKARDGDVTFVKGISSSHLVDRPEERQGTGLVLCKSHYSSAIFPSIKQATDHSSQAGETHPVSAMFKLIPSRSSLARSAAARFHHRALIDELCSIVCHAP